MTTPSSDVAASDVKHDATKKTLVAISPFFIVKDLQASIAYYTERPGFEIDFQGPPGDVYYAGVKRDVLAA